MIACDKEIGWRESSRKLIVYSSDAAFHTAGDGLLGGIVEPNDGKCHLENNQYTMATEMDYPSIGERKRTNGGTLINDRILCV